MDRDELAKVIEEAEIAAGCFTVPAVRLAVADAALSWFREYLGKEETIAAASKAVAVTRFMREYSWLSREQVVDIIGACQDHEDARAALTSIAGK